MQSGERQGMSVLNCQNWKGSGYHIDIDDSVIIWTAVSGRCLRWFSAEQPRKSHSKD